MNGLDGEPLLAAVYAFLLLAAAFGLDAMARHSNRRADRYGTGGFRFHAHLDAWECPQGEYLHLAEHDRERRLLRYRARPLVCNACPAKPECTDSDEGREILQSLDDWPRSEAGKFHRLISLSLVVLAALLPAVVLVRHHDPPEVALLAAAMIGAVYSGRRLGRELGGRAAAGRTNALA